MLFFQAAANSCPYSDVGDPFAFTNYGRREERVGTARLRPDRIDFVFLRFKSALWVKKFPMVASYCSGRPAKKEIEVNYFFNFTTHPGQILYLSSPSNRKSVRSGLTFKVGQGVQIWRYVAPNAVPEGDLAVPEGDLAVPQFNGLTGGNAPPKRK